MLMNRMLSQVKAKLDKIREFISKEFPSKSIKMYLFSMNAVYSLYYLNSYRPLGRLGANFNQQIGLVRVASVQQNTLDTSY